VGPNSTGGLPTSIGRVTSALSSHVCCFVSSFCLVDPLCRKMTCVFLENIFGVKFLELETSEKLGEK
jgi:hypothetical protein